MTQALTSLLCFKKRHSLPVILQEERAECGHACVAMVSQFWGQPLSLSTLRSIEATSNLGANLLDLKHLLERLSFNTRALQVPLEEIAKIKTPAILHWNMNHFVVLKQVKKKQVIIHDPAKGLCKLSLEEFSSSFTGIVLEIEKALSISSLRPEQPLVLSQLLQRVEGAKKILFLLLIFCSIIEFLNLLNPLFLQYVTDKVLIFNELSNLYLVSLGFALLIFLQVSLNYWRGSLTIYFTNQLTEQFSSALLKHLLQLPLAFFIKRHKGDIQSKFQAINQIQQKITNDFIAVLLDGVMIVANLLIMFVYSPWLTIIVILSLLIYLSARIFSYQELKRQMTFSIQQQANAATIFLEILQAIQPLKAFLKTQERFKVWQNTYIQALNATIQVSKMNLFYQLLNQFLFHIEHLLVVTLGALLVLNHKLSLGMLIAFLAYRLLLVNKAFSFTQHIVDYKLISIQLQRLSDLVLQCPETVESGCGKLEKMKGALRLENISFKYRSDNYILFNVNLEIKAGEKVAIIGLSGSGKTTLLKIMMGLLKPDGGTIYVDELALNYFGLKNYRQFTASVMQEDLLLSGSILDNIAFFAETVDIERIYNVSKLAHIHDLISTLPMGYETLIGDLGSSLSGGEKQRILLARALYKQPKILFLDEATSHLDAENEKNINKSLKKLQITQIIIAHRQETIAEADRIIDLNFLNPE